MQIAPSLYRLGSGMVNSYLVEDAGQITVVDAGISGQWKELLAELASIGRSLDDVRGLVLTHGDTDHVGFAERLHRERAVPIYVHALDADRARGEVKKPNTGWGPISLRALARFLLYGARRGGLRTTPLTEVITFQDGETLDLPGSPRVIHLPGHTPGSSALYVPAVDAVFVGDAIATLDVLTGRRGPRLAPFTLDPVQAASSLERLASIEATWVLPGHGDAWGGGVASALREVRVATTK